ncbi:MAG: diadenylate cyclase CdaA [Anaerolineae bacterium]|nr:diadenylate cyclase CdaA [Anaerolineae bacterium]
MWDIVWLIQRLVWLDALDIFLVAALFFLLFYALRGTRAVPVVRGITAIFITLALLTRLVVKLRAFSWLVQGILPAFVVAVPVLFQPELRRTFEQIGRGRFFSSYHSDVELTEYAISAVVQACSQMAVRNVGALIVFERQSGLQDYIETGVQIDARLSPELLTTIFDHHTILHDGAVIICDGRLVAASCVMPLTSAFLADRELGLRHRAALGSTEEGDAIAVVVSEERGAISLTHNGRMIRDIDPARLEAILHTFLLPDAGNRRGLRAWFRRKKVKGRT